MTTATGPKTSEGKRIAARNATTHGLFARDVVLPRLGEDPAAYQAFLQELTAQINPASLLEQHYTEKIAAASWRLRRLHRWQAQLFEDMELPEDEILLRLDRVMRHETTLHRQIDTSVKMLGREVPHMTEGRARRRALADRHVTERECRQDEDADWAVSEQARKYLTPCPRPASLDDAPLDNCPITANCQNEPAPCTSTASECTGMACHAPTSVVPGKVAVGATLCGCPPSQHGVPAANCQNEPVPNQPLPQGEAAVGAWLAMPSRKAMPSEPEGFPHAAVHNRQALWYNSRTGRQGCSSCQVTTPGPHSDN